MTTSVGLLVFTTVTIFISSTHSTTTAPYFDSRNELACRNEWLMDDDWRRTAVNTLNDYRQSVANGTAKNKTGNLPAAKNMYQLFYNCKLEDFALDWVSSCGWPRNGSEPLWPVPKNTITTSGISASPLNKTEVKAKLISMFQSDLGQIVTNGIQPNLIYDNTNIQRWNNYVTGAKTAVGCAYYPHCASENATFGVTYYIACVFDEPSAAMGKPAYEAGSKCAQDSDCTTYNHSTCDTTTGLCNYVFYPSPAYYAQNWDKLDLKEIIYGLVPRGYMPYKFYSNSQQVVAMAQNTLNDVNRVINGVQQVADKAIPVLENFDQTIPDIANKVSEIGKEMGIRI
ncbi:unnamed protein product, partial [Mesorhabditis belari]|uniref:SCP domain-containing protein n=1 Tax=Mesorhabditis belari TaxID=2138241 RepID=A0AAF3FJZ7_9BILA